MYVTGLVSHVIRKLKPRSDPNLSVNVMLVTCCTYHFQLLPCSAAMLLTFTHKLHTQTQTQTTVLTDDGANRSNVGLSSAEANNVSLVNSDKLADGFGLSACTYNYLTSAINRYCNL